VVALIAVVDDSATVRRFVTVLLAGRHDTVEYERGNDALDGLPANPPDLVLLDIELPDLPGPDVLRQLRASASLAHVPIVALTAHAEADDVARFRALGFDGHVAKPIVDADAFFGAIERLLGGTRR
jgi:CheY-like chemotaxis protein